MKAIAIISLIIYLYSVFCIIRESYYVFGYKAEFDTSLCENETKEQREKRLQDKEEHLNAHLSLLLGLLITSVTFLLWVFKHEGFAHGFNKHLVHESLWAFLFLFSYSISAFTRHFRKERKDESMVLDIQEELKFRKK